MMIGRTIFPLEPLQIGDVDPGPTAEAELLVRRGNGLVTGRRWCRCKIRDTAATAQHVRRMVCSWRCFFFGTGDIVSIE